MLVQSMEQKIAQSFELRCRYFELKHPVFLKRFEEAKYDSPIIYIIY